MKIARRFQRRAEAQLSQVPQGRQIYSGARLYEPQHVPLQSKPLRVADPAPKTNRDTTNALCSLRSLW